MKWILFFIVIGLIGCNQKEERLSAAELEQIKSDIIKRSEKHANDLENLDHKSVMSFYANTQDFIVFGDGYYWGDYITMDGSVCNFYCVGPGNAFPITNLPPMYFSPANPEAVSFTTLIQLPLSWI